MFENKVRVLSMARAMAAHAASRQTLIARNVANADTPGYRARDMPSFAEAMRAAEGARLRGTRTGHINGGWAIALRPQDRPGAASPNGNSVSLEVEMMRAAEVRQAHDTALAIQTKLSGTIRAALGRGR
ncbi:MAG: FlgB family protein [Gemmobacter sp.]